MYDVNEYDGYVIGIWDQNMGTYDGLFNTGCICFVDAEAARFRRSMPSIPGSM